MNGCSNGLNLWIALIDEGCFNIYSRLVSRTFVLILGDVRSFARSEDVRHISGLFALFRGRGGGVVLIYPIQSTLVEVRLSRLVTNPSMRLNHRQTVISNPWLRGYWTNLCM